MTQKLLLSVDSMDAYMTLFGFNDQNVALIEQECSVTVSLRGAELHISGWWIAVTSAMPLRWHGRERSI